MSSYATKFILASLLIACISCSNADLVGDVCARALNPASCNKVLRTNPRAVQARDLPSLGFAAIDTAQGFTKSAQAIATSLSNQAKDPKTKEALKSCLENFGDAIGSLNECRASLTKKDKASLNIQASAASTDADTCNDDFQGPANLKQATQNVIDTCSAILALSNML